MTSTGLELNKSKKKIRKIMKYDFTRCNNLQFKAKVQGIEKNGYLKVLYGEKVYRFFTDSEKVFDASLQLEYTLCESFTNIMDFNLWAENHELEIIPRDPETYNDWKVGDKVKHNINDQVYTILAVLGEAIILSKDSGISITALATTDAITKYNKLILTDYEKELIHAQELEKKKECPFEKGDKVLVRDSDTYWRFDVFCNYEESAAYPYGCFHNEYEQCIPLNERTWKLLGTTDEYKEEE